MIKVIEMKFTLLSKRKELVIFKLTNFIVNSVGENTVYTTLRINYKIRKHY